MKVCKDYCGVTCTNGYCPIALRDEYEEYGCDTISKCEDCPYYKGCEDCIGKDLGCEKWREENEGDYHTTEL